MLNLNNPLVILAIQVAAGVLLIALAAFFSYLKGWIFQRKSPESLKLATDTFKILTSLRNSVEEIISKSNKLGGRIVNFYKDNSNVMNTELHNEIYSLIHTSIIEIEKIKSDLIVADSGLSNLKRAVIKLVSDLENRERIIKHLCNPPNLPAMHPGHVHDQLIKVNTDLNGLLFAALGEASLYLNGYGVNYLERAKYLKGIKKKYKDVYKENVAFEYRKVLQITSLHNSNK